MAMSASRSAVFFVLGLHIVASAASALAAPVFTQGGDGSFRNLNASGGALTGVDVTSALVRLNGSSATLASVAQQAASAVPLSLAGQPNGWLQLDANGLVPATSLPAAVASVDQTARSTASAAQAAANAAMPLSLLGKPNGAAPLDANGLVPVAALPASVTSPVDAAARASASTAQAAANAAQSMAAAAVPANLGGKPNGYAALDANAFVPLANLPASVISPVDATARASASAAQAAANAAQSSASAAVPASSAGKPNGYAALDTNGLVPTSDLPGAYTAATALASSTLGQANGPAKLDTTGSLSANVVAATSGAVERTLASHFADSVNGADFGMVCNGSTDDTAALKATVAAGMARPYGADIVLPAGQCEIGGEIDVAASTSLRFEGHGIGATHLEFTANTDGLVFTLSNGANLTIDDLTISKHLGTNPTGTTFSHRALIAQAAQINNGAPSHTQAGQVIIARINVYGSSPGGQIDGWAVAIGVIDINFPDLIDNVVSQPGGPISSAMSSPSSLQPYPTAYAPGIASDFLLQGLREPNGFSNAGAQDYTLDATVIGNAATGGLAGLDLDGTQGGYIAANRFFANTYGIRCDSKASTIENVTVVANFVQDTVDDIYFNGMQGAEIGSNMFWEFNSSAGMPTFVGVWLRNGSSNTITGNSLELNGSGNPAGEDGIDLTSDATAGGFANFPSTVTGNNIYNVHGIGIGNDATTSALVVSSNSINLSTPSDVGLQDLSITSSNPHGNNDYVANSSPYPDIKSDTNGSIFVRRSLSCGGPYDACAFTVTNNGSVSFSTDASGNATVGNNLTVGGTVRAPGFSSPVVSIGAAPNHTTIQASLWAYAAGTVTLTTNGAGQNTSNSLPGLPSATTSGSLSISGRVLCSASSGVESFRFAGIWLGSSSGTLTLKSFGYSEDDNQSSPPNGWGMQGAVDTTNNLPLLQVTGLPATGDCTAQVAELINQ